jgi:hypothetical protein
MAHFFRAVAGIWSILWMFGGVWDLVVGVWRARWQGQLAVVNDVLILRSMTPFGTRSRQWQRASVVDVRIGRACCEELEAANCELQIHLKDKKIVRVLPGYGDQELQWLATMLRRTLRVPKDVVTAQDGFY